MLSAKAPKPLRINPLKTVTKMDVTVLFNQILYLWLETSHMFSKPKVERKRIHKDLWSVVSAPSDTIHEELYLCFII